jgi:ribosome maturation factor RimP
MYTGTRVAVKGGREPTFLLPIGLTNMADRTAVVAKIREIAERVAAREGMEIVDVQFLGGGASRLVRIFIDKPAGVSHADCEFVSQNVGTILDVEDAIPGGSYTLEVSSPGVERKLSKPQEFERFSGKKIKVVLRQAVEGQRHWAGLLRGIAEGIVTLEPAPGKSLRFPLDQVEKANLKFEW